MEERDASPREGFERVARLPGGAIDLAEAALLIAAEEYPRLDVARERARLDALAEAARPGLPREPLRARVGALGRFLFEQQGFRGDEETYHDPRNSYLNDVLDRRRGIPITLCLVYVEVARRLGLDARGVGFPGHFLAKVVGEEELVVDAFHGRLLPESACAELLRRTAGEDAVFDARIHLRASSPREILARMLTNLKHIHLRGRDFGRALACCERILLLLPDAPLELRDRGLVFEQLECFAAALRDYERFLELAPEDASAPAVRGRVAELRARAPALH